MDAAERSGAAAQARRPVPAAAAAGGAQPVHRHGGPGLRGCRRCRLCRRPRPPGPPAADTGVPVASATAPAGEPVRTAEAASPQASAPAQPVQTATPPRQVAVVPPRQRPPAPHPAPAHAVAQAQRPEIRPGSHIRDAAYDPRAVERDRRQRDARIAAYRQQFRPEPPPAYRRPVVAGAASPRFPRSAPPPQPYSGSLLGMAQGRAEPCRRPGPCR